MRTRQGSATPRVALWRAWPAALLLSLAACGGGGGGGSTAGSGTTPTSAPAESLQASSALAQRCAPGNPYASSAQKTGSLALEKQWLRSYFDEVYLWPEDVPGVNPNEAAYSGGDVYAALDSYFEALKSPRRGEGGERRDRFSFTLPTQEWQQWAASGIEAGYGFEWSAASATPPRSIRVAYVEAGSAAERAGVRRGDILLSADAVGVDASDGYGVEALYEALYPSQAGRVHSFMLQHLDGSIQTLSLVSAEIALSAVPLRQVLTAADGARIGHLVFHNHMAPAEAQLIEAISYFKAQRISDLVLDMRYNGGGYLYIASELAYMIAGPGRVGGRVFERLSFNSKRSAETANTPFYSTACLSDGARCTSSQPLPSLDLGRVFVLTGDGTCSASEAVINGLRGIDVEVIQIGGRTCGKPYGFNGRDNCGISYFPIEFVGVNAKGFGDYAEGFVPGTGGGRRLPGCELSDDLSLALGDPAERLLAGALGYRSSGSCSASVGLMKPQAAGRGEGAAALPLRRAGPRGNRMIGGR